MSTQTKTGLSVAAPARSASLPAGAGILLAMVIGGAFWLGLYALIA